MTVTSVTYVRLKCDSCGKSAEADVIGATSARIKLSADGWKYAEYDVRGLNKYVTDGNRGQKRRIVPKQWDSCPGCPLPTDAIEAEKIRNARSAK